MSNFAAIDQSAVINTPSIVNSAGTALAVNTGRRSWSIQNTGTNPLFVCLGSTASTTVFHYVLKAGTGASDGTGGSVGESVGLVYTGLISVAGTSPLFVVRES